MDSHTSVSRALVFHGFCSPASTSHICRMVSSNHGYLLILLVATIQSFILVSASNGTTNMQAFLKIVAKSTHVPWIEEIRSDVIPSGSACANEIAAFLAASDAGEQWALEMQDANSKTPSGILKGNVVDLGMWDECVGVDGSYDDVKVRGKHCTVMFGSVSTPERSKPMSSKSRVLDLLRLPEFILSVCFPSSCNETQALEIANSYIKNLPAKGSSATEIGATTAICSQEESEDFTVGEICTIVFFSAVGAAILFCTMCEFAEKISPSKMSSVSAVKTLAKFSLYRNFPALFNTKVKPGTMPAINGIRFLSTCWIVALHQRSMFEMISNRLNYPMLPVSWDELWFETASFATDNFFMISAFFTSYLFFKKLRSGGGLDLPMMYLHRYIRLTPGIMAIGLFLGFLYPRIGNGPMWKHTVPFLGNCGKSWWISLFYVQNFLPAEEICLLPSWFLAADMQLFLISPAILYALHRWPKYGLSISGALLVSSIVVPTLVVGLNGYTIVGLPSFESFENYYIRSYTRAVPYAVGLILGYDIATKKREFGQATVVLGWMVTCVLVVLCCLGMHRLKLPNIAYDLVFQTACAALLRPFWAIAMAWIIYACTHGHGGVLARLLSLPIFAPLSRISFGVYLTHVPVIVFKIGITTTSSVFLGFDVFDHFLSNLILSMAISTVISLFIDMPVMILENVLKTSYRNRNQTSTVKDVHKQEAQDETLSPTQLEMKTRL